MMLLVKYTYDATRRSPGYRGSPGYPVMCQDPGYRYDATYYTGRYLFIVCDVSGFLCVKVTSLRTIHLQFHI